VHSIHEAAWDAVKGTLPSSVNSAEEVRNACDTEISKQTLSLQNQEKLVENIEVALSKLPTLDQFNQIDDNLGKLITDQNTVINNINNDIKVAKNGIKDNESKLQELMADQARIESQECSAYFEGLIVGVQTVIDGHKAEIIKNESLLVQAKEKLLSLNNDKKVIDEKRQDHGKLKEALVNSQAYINELKISIGSLRREQENFVGLITQFLDSKKSCVDAQQIQDNIQGELKNNEEFVTKLNEILQQESDNRKRISEIDLEYSRLTPNVDKMKDELRLANTELDEEMLKADQLKRSHIVVGIYRDVLDEVWSYITQRIIPQLNSKLPYYTEQLGLGFSMKINPKDITKPVFSGKPGIASLSLKDDLSDGQKRLISMALAHSLRDMEASVRGIEVGWLIIDEFSNSLSPHLVEQVIEFEKNFARERNISLIVISHDVPLKSFQWDHRTTITRDTYSRIHQKKV